MTVAFFCHGACNGDGDTPVLASFNRIKKSGWGVATPAAPSRRAKQTRWCWKGSHAPGGPSNKGCRLAAAFWGTKGGSPPHGSSGPRGMHRPGRKRAESDTTACRQVSCSASPALPPAGVPQTQQPQHLAQHCQGQRGTRTGTAARVARRAPHARRGPPMSHGAALTWPGAVMDAPADQRSGAFTGCTSKEDPAAPSPRLGSSDSLRYTARRNARYGALLPAPATSPRAVGRSAHARRPPPAPRRSSVGERRTGKGKYPACTSNGWPLPRVCAQQQQQQ